MAIIRNLVVKISADISSLSKGLKQASNTLTKVSQSFTKIGTSLTASVTAPLVALGTTIVKTSAEFEQSMANAASVAGATGEELERMTALAREMGSKTVYSASDAADALYYMASAGYKVDQMEDSIEAILNLASATQYDLAGATDIVIATLNQFGLEASSAERVTNVFASAIGNSMASMDKLANSMGYVGPVANSLGYEIEDITGALSVLYNAGYDGSTAGTTLRQALVSLMNPSSAALEVFKELGLTYDELNPATNDFAKIVDTLGEAGMNTAQAMKVFGARGGPGMLALMGQGGDAIRDMTEAITGTNKANEMASTQLNTLSGQWKILKSELEEIKIMFGDILIPLIRNFISKYISPLTKKLMSLSQSQRKQIVNLSLIAAAIGPVCLAIGKVIGVGAKLIKFIPMIFSKVGLIIAVIALVVASLIYLYKNNEEFRNKVNKLWESVKTKVVGVLEKIKGWWQENGQAIMKKIGDALMFIAGLVINVLGVVFDTVRMTLPTIKTIVTDVIKIIRSLWTTDGESTKKAIVQAFNIIGNVIRRITEEVNAIIMKVWPYIKMVIVDTIEGIKSVLSKDGGKILSIFKKIFDTMKKVYETYYKVLKTSFSKLSSYIKPLWQDIKNLFTSLWNCIKELYQTLKPIFQVIGAVILFLYGVIVGIIDGIISAIGPLLRSVTKAVTAIIEIIRAICALLRGDFSQAWEHIKQVGINVWESLKQFGLAFVEFFKGFCEGFMVMFSALKDKILALLQGFWDAVKTWWSKVEAAIIAIGEWFWSWIEPLLIGIRDFFVGIWNAIVTFIKETAEKIKNVFINILEGIKNTFVNIWTAITDLFTKIKNYFANLISDAFNWGKNLIQNIADGIKSAWNSVVDGVKQIGQSIADFLGFGSPTKKGPGHKADEWIPNLLGMMKNDLYEGVPTISEATAKIASALNINVGGKAVVGTGSSPYSDLLNGYLQTRDIVQGNNQTSDIILQIDGQTFARLIAPKLTKEYKRNGITLREV